MSAEDTVTVPKAQWAALKGKAASQETRLKASTAELENKETYIRKVRSLSRRNGGASFKLRCRLAMPPLGFAPL